MKKIFRILTMTLGLIAAIGCFTACGQETATKVEPAPAAAPNVQKQAPTAESETNDMKKDPLNIKITVNGQVLHARLEDNVTTRALVKKMPMTLPMSDLYGREMCFRYGAGALPTDQLRSDRYEVGDICYWPPRGSLVILYAQNGEEFERQQIGHIDSGVELFSRTGDAQVTFEQENS